MISYLVLHYKNMDVTLNCVDSILRLDKVNDRKVVIVDNGSRNGTYERILTYYENNNNVDVIENKENLGFAKGNNVGYRYIKNRYNSELIVVCNNDLVFEDKSFELLLGSFK